MSEVIKKRTEISVNGTELAIVKVRTNDLNPYRIALNGDVIGKISSEVLEKSEGKDSKVGLICNVRDKEIKVWEYPCLNNEYPYTDEHILWVVAKILELKN